MQCTIRLETAVDNAVLFGQGLLDLFAKSTRCLNIALLA